MEHLLEASGAWTSPVSGGRPIVLGRHAVDVPGTTVVTADLGARDDLARRTAAAAADSPEVHLVLSGTLARGKANRAVVEAVAHRLHSTEPNSRP
ncbi:hypothetical protein [Streptomyces sp. NPDC001205]